MTESEILAARKVIDAHLNSPLSLTDIREKEFTRAAETGWPAALDALEASRKEVARLRKVLAQTTVDVGNLPTFAFKEKVRAALSPQAGETE